MGRTLERARHRLLRAALLLVALAAASSARAAQPWSVLVLIYSDTAAACPVAGGSPIPANVSLSFPQIFDVSDGILDFERIVSEWSSGLGAAHIRIEFPERAISRLTPLGAECVVSPEDVAEELDRHVPSGEYDSVIAIWHQGSGSGAIPGPRWWSTRPLSWKGRTLTFASLHADAFFPPNPGSNFRDPGESILEAWLAAVVPFYQAQGYSVAGIGESASYGFPDANPDGPGGLREFYSRLLQGRLVDSLGKYTGMSAAVWAAGSPRVGSGAQPAPQQLVAPPDLLCQPDDAVLEWTGPWPAQTIFEVRLDDDQGSWIIHQTSLRSVALADLPLQSGRTYRWTVRTLAAPPGSAVDELGFLATGPGPEPPTFLPREGLLVPDGEYVFVFSLASADVRYTLDGADPTPADLLVPEDGVLVVPPATLKARVFAPDCAPSSVATATYGLAQVLTVTNTDDTPVGPPDDGSLRKAIVDANQLFGEQVVQFAIPGPGPHKIDIGFPLPTITDRVTIDGWSQPGFSGVPLIELDGSIAGSGLILEAGDSLVRGLVINNSGVHGIRLRINGGNVIQGCYIGTNVAGSAASANQGHGVYIEGVGDNVIGGSLPFTGNLISGNGFRGIEIAGAGASGNLIVGNRIGTDRHGTSRIPNGYGGIELDNAPDNQIGGARPSWRNLISGNGFSGIADTGDGIGIAGPLATRNWVLGNRIGTDVNGTADLGNSRAGVLITELVGRAGPAASGNRIGGTQPGEGNVISGNDGEGIGIVAVGGGATGNVVQGNFIGTDASGSFDLGNSLSGVSITRRNPGEQTASGNLIGGTEPGARNVISGNNLDGVGIIGQGVLNGEGNSILGNFIGTDVQGIFDVGNSRSGVRLTTTPAFGNSATFNKVGGPGHAARNVISGNDQNGIAIIGNLGGGGSNTIAGNWIGLGATGGSGPGNGGDGILVTTSLLGGSTSLNQIGGILPGTGNAIGRNGGTGIRLEGAGTRTNFVYGNLVGVDRMGTPQPNGGDGIFVSGPRNGIFDNAIAWNAGAGAVVSAASQNWIHENSIFQNGLLGIDLINGNGLQPAPVLNAVTTSSGTLIRGTLSAQPDTEYELEFFSSPVCDPSGSGEGMIPLGRTLLTTDGLGSAAFFSLPVAPVPLGQVVTATATEYRADNTSEFSACMTAAAGPPGDPDGDQNPGGGDNCPGVPNPGQEDTGGLNTSLPDGRGNACECGDVSDDGIVDAADLTLFRAHLVDPGVPFGGAILGKCSVFGASPSLCNLVDVVVLRRALSGRAPGISGVCALG